MTLLLLFVAFLSIAQGLPAKGKLWQSDRIDSCSIVAEHYFSGPDDPRQIWLRSTVSEGPAIFLTTYNRNAELLFSPDCMMIVLNDNLGSDVSEVRLFRRHSQDLRYEPVKVDITGKAWSALRRENGLKKPLNLDHAYVNAITWSADSNSILLRLWGHTDIKNHIDQWLCVYDVPTDSVSTDLKIMNRKSVVTEGKER